jgi:hypothetical protein
MTREQIDDFITACRSMDVVHQVESLEQELRRLASEQCPFLKRKENGMLYCIHLNTIVGVSDRHK